VTTLRFLVQHNKTTYMHVKKSKFGYISMWHNVHHAWCNTKNDVAQKVSTYNKCKCGYITTSPKLSNRVDQS